MPSWIRVTDRLPEEGAAVWYFFEVTGVCAGHYLGRDEDGLDTFGGKRGFLGGDVTHWLPREESEDESCAPPPPQGYSKAERAFIHGSILPFDGPDGQIGRMVDQVDPDTEPELACARAVFHVLDDRSSSLRQALRNLPHEERQRLTKAVVDVLKVHSASVLSSRHCSQNS